MSTRALVLLGPKTATLAALSVASGFPRLPDSQLALAVPTGNGHVLAQPFVQAEAASRLGLTQALEPLATDPRTLAWILYSVAIASGKAPASRTDISTAADAINHAVPTQQELNGALHQLVACGHVESHGKFHALTQSGQALFQKAQVGSSTVTAVWAALTTELASVSGGL